MYRYYLYYVIPLHAKFLAEREIIMQAFITVMLIIELILTGSAVCFTVKALSLVRLEQEMLQEEICENKENLRIYEQISGVRDA